MSNTNTITVIFARNTLIVIRGERRCEVECPACEAFATARYMAKLWNVELDYSGPMGAGCI